MGVTQTQTAGAAKRPEYPVVRIEARRGWLALDLGELWAYRDLVYFFIWRDIKVRYKQTAIGAAWAILQPVLTMMVFSLFFGKLARIPSQGLPYPIFYYTALLPWMYFATAMQSATNVVVEQQRVITKIYFPRVVLPIAAVLAGLLDFAIAWRPLAPSSGCRCSPCWPCLLLWASACGSPPSTPCTAMSATSCPFLSNSGCSPPPWRTLVPLFPKNGAGFTG
jgi:hypothetical protein